MANPSPAAVAAIRAQVADWSRSDRQIADDLNVPVLDNPTPQGQVFRSFTVADLINAVPVAGRANLGQFLQGAAGLVIAQDRDHLANGIDGLVALGAVAPADGAAMKLVLDRKVPDPDWPAKVSWAEANLHRPADADDVAAARPQGS